MKGEITSPEPLQRIAIIPAYNEQPVIGRMLAAIPPGVFDRILVADNGSSDGTAGAAAAHGAEVVSIRERGYGAACLAAMETLGAASAVLVFLQADGSEDALEAREIMAPVLQGEADLVIGNREGGRAQPGSLLPHQRFGNRLAGLLIRILYGHRYHDLGPLRAIRLDVLRRLDMRERTYGWTVEMQVKALQQGLRVMELPVSYGHRQAGSPKVSGNAAASLRAGILIVGTIVRLWLRALLQAQQRPQNGNR